jgi:hypothetical protein
MDQTEFVQGTVVTLVNLQDEGEGDCKPTRTRSLDPTIPTFASYGNEDI